MQLFILIALYIIPQSYGDIYDLEDELYEKMPPPYQLDDFEKCLKKPKGLYCIIDMDVISDEASELDNMIKEYSNYVGHYNYSKPLYGICVSEKCGNITDVQNRSNAIQSCMNEIFYEKYQLMVSVTELQCHTPDEDIEVNSKDIVVAVFLFGILMLNIVGSIYDVYFHGTNTNIGINMLLCFSLRRNWRKLRAPAAAGPEKRLKIFKAISGIKLLITFTVVGGHALLLFIVFLENPRFVEQLYKSYWMRFLFSGPVIVQTFFMISGLLLAYNLQLIQEKRKFGWFMIPMTIIFRWMRLIPPLVVSMAIVCTWFKFIGSGPLKHRAIMKEYDDCHKYWWQNILFIYNFYNDKQQCFQHTWYLAAEFQMFVVGTFICIIFKSIKSKMIVLAILLMVAFIIPPWKIYYMDLDSLVILSPKLLNTYLMSDKTFINSYTATETNIFNYFLGLALGLVIYKLQKNNFDLKKYKKYSFVVWMLIPVGMGVVAPGMVFYAEQPRQPLYARMLYGALVKPLFGIVIATAILLILFNLNVTLKAIFEWNGWRILSKLSYSTYIVHFIFVKMLAVNIQALIRVTYLLIIQNILWCILESYLTALPLWLLVEAPFLRLVKICFIPSKELSEMEKGIKYDKSIKVNEEQFQEHVDVRV